jgi:hypothetical protein
MCRSGCSFTCLATELDFHDEKPPVSADPGLPMPSAIDYAGVTCESRPFPVLGFSRRSEAEVAYPLLLARPPSLFAGAHRIQIYSAWMKASSRDDLPIGMKS